MTKTPARNTQGLRDILFDEIDGLRDGTGDATKSQAIANLAKQIVNTAKIELEFHRAMHAMELDGAPIELGNLQLGARSKPAAVAGKAAKAA